jgi:tetratricopeptide (TPR) repeat protein
LEIYPDCVDALSMLADLECELLRDYIEAKRKAVEAGRRELGAEVFKQDKGHFWLMIETRPFMRAMAGLAEGLGESGNPEHQDEAIEIYEEMLELNPGDNQGVRYPLVGCYLTRRRYDDASALLSQFEEDAMAPFAWARVLLAYATEGPEAAEQPLARARADNVHVENYLTSKKRMPKHRPGAYSPGDESEAIMCAEFLKPAWNKHQKAKRWLKEMCAQA